MLVWNVSYVLQDVLCCRRVMLVNVKAKTSQMQQSSDAAQVSFRRDQHGTESKASELIGPFDEQ